MTRTWAALCAALVLGLAGCADTGAPSAAPTSAAPTGTTSAAPVSGTSETSESSETTEPGGSQGEPRGGGSVDFCAMNTEFTKIGEAKGEVDDPEEAKSFLRAYAEAAPAAISADVEVLVEIYTSMLDGDEKAVTDARTEEGHAAATRIVQWLKANCGG